MTRRVQERVHFSELKKIGTSPAHYLHTATQPRTSKGSAAMVFGTLVHAIVLGADFAVYEGERRGNAWRDFADENVSRLIVTRKEYDRALPCAEAVIRHPIASQFIRGRREVYLEWEWCGRACAGQLDVLAPWFITDLKITASASPGWFRYQAIKMGWHVQGRWYQIGAEQNGHEPREVYIIACESKPPHAVTVFRLPPETLQEGERIARSWMETLLVCEDADSWPEYAQCVVDLEVNEAGPDLIWGDEETEEEAA